MSGLIDDWEAVPVTASAKPAPKSIISDWDAVPVNDAKSNVPHVDISGVSGDPNHAGLAQRKRITDLASQFVDSAKKNPGEIMGAYLSGPEAGLNMVSGLASSAVGGLAGIGRGLYGLATGDNFDTAAGHAADVSSAVQQAGTYQPRTTGGKLATEFLSVPMNAASQATRSMGGDVGQFSGGDKGRMIGEEIGGAVPAMAGAVAGGVSMLSKPRVAPVSLADRVEPTLGPQGVTADMMSKPRVKLNVDGTQTVLEPSAQSAQQTPAQPAPTSASFAQAENLAPTVPTGPIGKVLPPAEQAERAAVLQRIGLDKARQSAVAGDGIMSATQSQMAKFNEPAGIAAKELLDSERVALQNHAASIVDGTGGLKGMDESALGAKGRAIDAPIEGFKKYFEDSKKSLYSEADAQSGGLPTTNLDGFKDIINKNSNFDGKAENGALGKGIRSYLREQNIMDVDGNLRPVTPKEAEGIRQYINGQWSPSTSQLAGKIKGAIDDDVFSHVGNDIYKKARDLSSLEKRTLENPNGIFQLFDHDKYSINRSTAFKDIPDALKNLDPEQFKHVLDTLKSVPDELQPQAQQAIATIKSHMAESLLNTGNKLASKWNAKGVSNELSNNSEKLPMVFNADEMGKIQDLNKAGHILSVDASYPGASAQASNAMKQGLMPHVVGGLTAAAGGLAGSIFGPIGSTVGGVAGRAAGNKAATSIGERAALKKFNKGVVKLSDVTP